MVALISIAAFPVKDVVVGDRTARESVDGVLHALEFAAKILIRDTFSIITRFPKLQAVLRPNKTGAISVGRNTGAEWAPSSGKGGRDTSSGVQTERALQSWPVIEAKYGSQGSGNLAKFIANEDPVQQTARKVEVSSTAAHIDPGLIGDLMSQTALVANKTQLNEFVIKVTSSGTIVSGCLSIESRRRC